MIFVYRFFQMSIYILICVGRVFEIQAAQVQTCFELNLQIGRYGHVLKSHGQNRFQAVNGQTKLIQSLKQISHSQQDQM